MENTSLDDLVFENRNKSYGAYLLRHLYEKHVLVSVFITGSLFITLLGGPVIIKSFLPEEAVVMPKMVSVETIEIPSIDPNVKPPPLPKIEPPKISTLKFVPPEIKPDELVNPNEKVATQDDLKDKAISTETVKVDSSSLNQTIANENLNNAIGDGDEEGFMAVSRDAQFTGGDLNKYLKKNMVYPPSAKAAEIQGSVVVSYEVSPEGKIVNVKVLKGLTSACDAEAIRVVKSLDGLYKPATQGGHAIKRTFKLPIKFNLDQVDY
jgi:periplasmic protein TonB